MSNEDKIIKYWPDVYTKESGGQISILKSSLGEWILRPSWTKLEAAMILTGYLPRFADMKEDEINFEKPVIDGRISVSDGVDIFHTNKLFKELKRSTMFDSFSAEAYINWASNNEFYRLFCMPGNYQLANETIKELMESSISFREHMNDQRRRYSSSASFTRPTKPDLILGDLIEGKYVCLIDYLLYLLHWWKSRPSKDSGVFPKVNTAKGENLIKKVLKHFFDSEDELVVTRKLLLLLLNYFLKENDFDTLQSINTSFFRKLWRDFVPTNRKIYNNVSCELYKEIERKIQNYIARS